MSDDEEIAVAKRLFHSRLRADHNLIDLEQLGSLVPKSLAALRHMWALCMTEARVQMTKGRHLEGRRLSVIAEQIRERMDEDH